MSKPKEKMQSVKVKGHLIYRRCLSCENCLTGSEQFIQCNKDLQPKEKNFVCKYWNIHPRFEKIGVSQGQVKPRAYYRWRLFMIKKFTRNGDTNWKGLETYLKPYGDLYEYWKIRIKNNPQYEDI